MTAEEKDRSYLTPQRRYVISWMERNAPVLAELYQGALDLLYGDTSVRGRFFFSAHAIREIRNRLPEAFFEVASKPRLDYPTRMDGIAGAWAKVFRIDDTGAEVRIDGSTSVPDSDRVEVPLALFRRMSSLVKDHADTRTRVSENARRMFLVKAPESKDAPEALEPVVKNWLKKTDWFLRAHVGDIKQREWNEGEFFHHFDVFERAVGSLINEFYQEVDFLNDVLSEANKRTAPAMPWTKPADGQIEQAVAHLVRGAHRRFFFEKLENPLWVKPLWEKGLLKRPPAPRFHEGGGVSFPTWPEAKYLVRAAAESPQEVHDVIAELHTENVNVHRELLGATLHFRGRLAGNGVDKALEWLAGKYTPYWPDEYARLALHAAREGEIDKALQLLRSLLAIIPDSERGGGQGALLGPRPRARFTLWHYSESLRKYSPDLVAVVGEPIVGLLCDLLDTAIQFRVRTNEPPFDVSHIWRPAIEDNEQNHPIDVADALVTAVRDTAIALMRNGGKGIADIVTDLVARRWMVFQRVALHILSVERDAPLELIREHAGHTERFDQPYLRHEYLQLLKVHFSRFSELEQDHILGALDEQVANSKMRKRVAADRVSSDEDIQRAAKFWRARQLFPLRDVLPTKWKEVLNELIFEVGEPDHAEFTSWMGGEFAGPTSPKTAEELSAMDIASLVTFLQSWVPAGRFDGPSAEGLGQMLKDVVARKADVYAASVESLKALDPTYVRNIISGLEDAVNQGKTFDWRSVLDLLGWVLEQPREIAGRSAEYDDWDTGWIGTRKAVADLLGKAFEKQAGEVPFALRKEAWKVLAVLARDPDPTAEYEATYGGTNMNPAMLAINTTRGTTLHAVVRYALWVRRHGSAAAVGANPSFEEMPEVREVLEWHLDPRNEQSLAIRSVYGQWLPWLKLLDGEWTVAHLKDILPTDPAQTAYRDAAWETYLLYSTPYNEMLPILLDEYDMAIARLPQVGDLSEAETRVVEHLMLYYGRGQLSLEWLNNHYFEKAPAKARAHGMEFIGSTLRHQTDPLGPETQRLFHDFWKQRLDAAGNDRERWESELVEFGWWFTGALGTEWELQQLEAVLEEYGHVEPNFFVFERLATIAQTFPGDAVRCSRLIVDGWDDPLKYYEAQPHLRPILVAAKESGSTKAQSDARAIANKLGEYEYFEFRDLL